VRYGRAEVELQVTIEATVDLRDVFELAAVRAGLASAIVTVKLRSAADEAVLDKLGQTVSRASAVFDSLAKRGAASVGGAASAVAVAWTLLPDSLRDGLTTNLRKYSADGSKAAVHILICGPPVRN
jgi:hypothetical protein